jgi:hypothetical protein
MPKTKQFVPDGLRPYAFHGLDLRVESRGEAIGDCPFCGREDKFTVNVETGQYKCWVCADGTDKGGGNPTIFVRHFWNICNDATDDYNGLSRDRGIDFTALDAWGVVRSTITGDWLVPAFGVDREIKQLYKYVRGYDRMLLLPTPTLGAGLFGIQNWGKDKAKVYLCEGPWDGAALWQALGGAKKENGTISATASKTHNLLADANVVAVPGCGAVGDPLRRWATLFSAKAVVLCFDNDWPGRFCEACKTRWKGDGQTKCERCGRNGKRIEPAGYAATRRAAKILSESSVPPASVSWLRWSAVGDHDPALPDGCDVRDVLLGRSADAKN